MKKFHNLRACLRGFRQRETQTSKSSCKILYFLPLIKENKVNCIANIHVETTYIFRQELVSHQLLVFVHVYDVLLNNH